MQSSYFLIKSHSQVAGVKTGTYFLGNTSPNKLPQSRVREVKKGGVIRKWRALTMPRKEMGFSSAVLRPELSGC